MKLPRNEVGISDILQYLDCPARFVFKMRRHEQGAQPESWSPANAYGSAIHLAVKMIDQGATEDEAVQAAVAQHGTFLEPDDVAMLYADLEIYLQRDELGVETVISEEDCRVPLFEHDGEQIFFRFQIDRLYRRLDNPSAFIHIDYKSSKWLKSQEEVDNDRQLWSYNFGIVELYPEIEGPGGSLVQWYDQFRGGRLFTTKAHDQRERMRAWLIHQVTTILEDDSLDPSFNQWCPWCEVKMDCPVVRYELTDYAQSKIAKLAPRKPKPKKDGSPGKTLLPPELDPERFDEYAEELPRVKTAIRTLEAFRDEVESTMKKLPAPELGRYGKRLDSRSRRVLSPEAMRFAHELLDHEFYYVASLSEASLERFFGKGDERIGAIMDLAERGPAYAVLADES